VSDQEYYVEDNELQIYAKRFEGNISDCQPFTYKATKSDGSALPNFISFEPNSLMFRIKTSSVKNMGFYQVRLMGETEIYNDQLSKVYTTFNLEIKCQPQKITTGSQTIGR
jgi:hypothetical protein